MTTVRGMDAARVARDGADVLIEAVRRGEAAQTVPSCPDFTLSDLAFHSASAANFWTQMAQGVAPGSDVPLDRPDDADLAGWLTGVFNDVLRDLAAVDPANPMGFSMTEDATAGFAQRRVAHELAMHGWDAANAVAMDDAIATGVVLDGIDEYLEVWLGSVFGDRSGVRQTVHLHATDLEGSAGEWHVTVGDDELLVTHEHAKGDVAVRGGVQDLLLLVWGRIPVDAVGLEVFGDRAELSRFIARVKA